MNASNVHDFDVAAFCAHPDDAELLAGGTLRREAARGRKVAIVDLTAGERGSRGTPGLRATEAAAAARILGVAHRECLGLPDAGLALETAHKDRVVEALRRLRPRVVITHHPAQRHPDHANANPLVTQAVYLAGLAGYLPGVGTPYRPMQILAALGLPGDEDVRPIFVVDICGQWDAKMQAVRAYASQFLRAPGTPHGALDGVFEHVELTARWHGRRIGVAYGEGFVTATPIALDGVCGLVAIPD